LNGLWCYSAGIIACWMNPSVFTSELLFLNGFWCFSVGIIVRWTDSGVSSLGIYCLVEWIMVCFPSELLFFEWIIMISIGILVFFFFLLNGFWCFSVGTTGFWMDSGGVPSELLFFEGITVFFHRNYCCLNGFGCFFFSAGILAVWLDSGVWPPELLFFWMDSSVFYHRNYCCEWIIVFFHRNYCFVWMDSSGFPQESLFFLVDSDVFSVGIIVFLNGFLCFFPPELLLFEWSIVFLPSSLMFVWMDYCVFFPSELLFFWMDSGGFPSEVLSFCIVSSAVRRNHCFFLNWF